MVRAILDGLKTQTRRALNPQPEGGVQFGSITATHGVLNGNGDNLICKFGKKGDRLWVKETSIITPKHWNDGFMCDHIDKEGDARMVQYIATHPDTEGADQYGLKKTPSIFMPRWASRILLEIMNARVERLNDISEDDAIAEGIDRVGGEYSCSPWRNYRIGKPGEMSCHCSFPPRSYMTLWESINGQGSWDLNPWVWVLEFKVISKC